MENIFEKIKEKFGCAVAYMSNSAKSKLEKSKLIKKSVPFVLGITLATIQLTGCSNEKNIVEENITFENEPSFDKKDNKPIQEHTVTEEELSEILIDESITFENEPSLTEDTEYCQIDLKNMLTSLLTGRNLNEKTISNLINSITTELQQYGNLKFYIEESKINTTESIKTIYILNDNLSNHVMNSIFQIWYDHDGGFSRFLVHLYEIENSFSIVSYDIRNNDGIIEKFVLYGAKELEYKEDKINENCSFRKLYFEDRILSPFRIYLEETPFILEGQPYYILRFISEDYELEKDATITVGLLEKQTIALQNLFEEYKRTAEPTLIRNAENMLLEYLKLGYQEDKEDAYEIVESSLLNQLRKLVPNGYGRNRKQ